VGICFRLKAKIIEVNFTACTLNGRAGYRVKFLRCEANLFQNRECPIFYGHFYGRKIDKVLFLLVGFLIRNVVVLIVTLWQLSRYLWRLLPTHRNTTSSRWC